MLDELELGPGVDDEDEDELELGWSLDEELDELDEEELEELHAGTKSLGLISKVEEVLGIDHTTNFTPSPAGGVTVSETVVVSS